MSADVDCLKCCAERNRDKKLVEEHFEELGPADDDEDEEEASRASEEEEGEEEGKDSSDEEPGSRKPSSSARLQKSRPPSTGRCSFAHLKPMLPHAISCALQLTLDA